MKYNNIFPHYLGIQKMSFTPDLGRKANEKGLAFTYIQTNQFIKVSFSKISHKDKKFYKRKYTKVKNESIL